VVADQKQQSIADKQMAMMEAEQERQRNKRALEESGIVLANR